MINFGKSGTKPAALAQGIAHLHSCHAILYEEASKGALTKAGTHQYSSSSPTCFDIDSLDSRGRTAIGCVALKSHINFVKALKEEGADVSKTCKGNRSTLWYAAAGTMSPETRLELVNYLLDQEVELEEISDD